MERTMLRIDDTGEKPTAKAGEVSGKPRTSDDDTADIRDILNAFIGRGPASLQDEQSQNDFARLRALLGPEKASKLMTKVFIHNQSNADMPMEKKIQTFYDMGSNDKDVGDIITSAKTFGYGVIPGFRESGKDSIQKLMGRLPATTASINNDDLRQKVMLRLK